MNGLLVRVGIDSTDGGWNAPVRMASSDFAFITITETKRLRPGMARRYDEFTQSLKPFGQCLPDALRGQPTHLDPDFYHLTYGDQGQRGRRVSSLGRDDVLAFFAALCPVDGPARPLVYALIGLYVIDEMVRARDVPQALWSENAHTRRLPGETDIVVRARPGVSGRLRRCLPIGELRNRAYRVRRDLLKTWGGLDVQDGYIQRSVRLPAFLDAERFYRWFLRQEPDLIAANNLEPASFHRPTAQVVGGGCGAQLPNGTVTMTSSCSSHRAEEAAGQSWYNLASTSSKTAPETLPELDSLLRQWSARSNGEWCGKLYVASTIWYDESKTAFLQKGYSPNYRGGLWTLACCKHDMRAAASFKEQVRFGSSAVLILTLAGASGPGHRQYLVSAAKVTAWFDTMNDYASHLLELGNETLLREKLSNRRQATGLGRRFGDCHADGRGKVSDPNASHVHASSAGRDLDRTHLLLASDCFVVWSRPVLYARTTLRQSRYGINLTPGNLGRLLTGV